jgi:hypothetical protein
MNPYQYIQGSNYRTCADPNFNFWYDGVVGLAHPSVGTMILCATNGVSTNGPVGIGTTGPRAKLDVDFGSAGGFQYLTNSGANEWGLKLYSSAVNSAVGGFTANGATGEVKIGGLLGSYFLTFYSGNSEAMRITTNGNVSIGDTTATSMFNVGTANQFQVSSTGVSSAGAGSTDLNGSGVPEAHCLADGTGCPGYALASGPTSWTPTDASGAGLTFTGVNVSSSRVGNMVFVYGSLSYPVTANINTAQIGGLPIAVSSGSYAFTPNGAANSTSPAVAYRCLPQGGTLSFTLTATSSSLSPTNANLSGSPLFFSFSYPIN